MIINHYAGNDKYGMEFRPFYLSRELCAMGHNVTVIAADCSHLRKENPVILNSYDEEFVDGVRFVFVKTIKYKKNDAKRFLNMASFLQSLKNHAKYLYEKYTPQFIIASSTYPYDVKSAKNIARHGKNVKVCYEIHDIWPLSLIEIYHLSEKNPYMQSLQRAENYAYKNADLVVSILPNVDRHIKELGFNDVNYLNVPNGVILNKKGDNAPKHIVDEVVRLKNENKFIVMYLGGFSTANALEDLIESAKIVNENVQIVMVGDGPLKEIYSKRIEHDGLLNISLMNSVTKSEVTATLALGDVLYIGAKKAKLYQYGIGMNKIFDYMLAKRPILYGIEASNNPAKEACCGITILPQSAKEIASGIAAFQKMSTDELAIMGQNGYEYVCKNHDYKILAEKFLSAMNSVLECDGK